MRQPLIRSYAVTHPPGDSFRLPRSQEWHQLIYARRGVVRAHTVAGTWTLPPHRAAWLRAGTEHRCDTPVRAALRTLYLRADGTDLELTLDAVVILQLTPLATELISTLVAEAPWFDDSRAHAYLATLADQLGRVDQLPVVVPELRCETCRRAAALVSTEPAHRWTVAGLATHVGFSKRTLERHFREEAGIGVGRWVMLSRLSRSLELLSQDIPVGEVATAVGYATQSAFGAMFKAQLGDTPTRFFGTKSR